MFDVGASELLMIAIVAIIVIGPKDMPLALRTAGRWVAKIRRVSGHFRAGLDAMIREAEMEELERKWREQNERIMAEHHGGQDSAEPAMAEASAEARAKAPTGAGAEAVAGPDAAEPPAAGAEARRKPAADPAPDEPQLPLGGPVSRHEP